MRRHHPVALVLALLLVGIPLRGDNTPSPGQPPASPAPAANQLSVQAVGKSAKDGQTLLTVKADNVDLATLLKEVKAHTDLNFMLAQDANAAVGSLSLSNVTLDQVLQHIQQAASPAISYERKNGLLMIALAVAPAPAAVDAAATRALKGSPRTKVGGRAGDGVASGAFGGGYALRNGSIGALSAANNLANQQLYLNSYGVGATPSVSLDVSDKNPLPLKQVLGTLGRATNTNIIVDPRVPSALLFAGRVTNASVFSTLDAIGRTAGLKVVGNPDGSVLMAPADEFTIFYPSYRTSYPNAPAQSCPNCGHTVLPFWSYCPTCGQLLPKQQQQIRARQQAPQAAPGFTRPGAGR